MWIEYNPNPRGNSRAGDCVIRGITKLTGKPWENVYTELSIYGYSFGDWGGFGGGSAFAKKIEGLPTEKVFALFDEVMDTLQVVNPRLYAAIMRKL